MIFNFFFFNIVCRDLCGPFWNLFVTEGLSDSCSVVSSRI